MFFGVELTISQHWFRWWLGAKQAANHYLKQWWRSLLTHICVTRPDWVKWYLISKTKTMWCSSILVVGPKLGEQCHTMDMLWEKFQWILPLYMKPISFQSKASVVCSVTAAIFIDFCLKKLNVFSQHIGKKNQMNIWIPQNKSPGIEMLTNFLCYLLPEILLNDAASTYCEKR